MQIRPERPTDAGAIRDITQAAFRGLAHSDQTEAAIVETLRAAGALAVSLVADQDGEILGHAAFSPVRIDGRDAGWFGLGPVSVRPGRQRTGIGRALILDGLGRLRALGAAGCVVLGDPAYYGRFGFGSDPALVYPPAPRPYFQRLVLAGPAAAGEVAYHPAFGSA